MARERFEEDCAVLEYQESQGDALDWFESRRWRFGRHHGPVSFQDEYRRLLNENQIPYDERYMWDLTPPKRWRRDSH